MGKVHQDNVLNILFSFLSVDAKSQESATKTPCLLADRASSSVLEGKKERKILHIYCCCRSEATVILSHTVEGIKRILTVVIEGEGG